MGLDPVEVWNLTPFEFSQYVKGFEARLQDEYRQMRYNAWMTEALARTKKLPKATTYIDPPVKKEKVYMSREEQEQQLAEIVAEFGE